MDGLYDAVSSASDISFGQAGNAATYQTQGWADPEDGFTCATGRSSGLTIPFINAPSGYWVEVSCWPFLQQQLIVVANGVPLGGTQVSQRGVFAWEASPCCGPLVLTLLHPDAARPCDVMDTADERELSLAFDRIRLLPPLPDHAQPPCDPIPRDRRDLALCFESLGDNCELGLLQRRWGAEPLGLLRFSSAPAALMVAGLDMDFAGITDDVEAAVTPDKTEWSMRALLYGMEWHTFTSPDAMSQHAALARERSRLPFLVQKLTEDIQEGRKLFVVKRHRELPKHEIMPLFLALRRKGPASMLLAGGIRTAGRQSIPRTPRPAPRLLRQVRKPRQHRRYAAGGRVGTDDARGFGTAPSRSRIDGFYGRLAITKSSSSSRIQNAIRLLRWDTCLRAGNKVC